jgi:hypothetical protein
VPKKRESSLSLHYKLFGKHHVPDIVGTFGGAATAGYMTRKEIMVALRDTCTYLDERKYLFERMILALENEEADGEGEGVDGEDNEENDENGEDQVEENEDEDADN